MRYCDNVTSTARPKKNDALQSGTFAKPSMEVGWFSAGKPQKYPDMS